MYYTAATAKREASEAVARDILLMIQTEAGKGGFKLSMYGARQDRNVIRALKNLNYQVSETPTRQYEDKYNCPPFEIYETIIKW